ncbi:hypothetical protein C0992_003924 [Termitomyces sp. T32_za158]|nr:hypothetical protein C0992_003924 [Termitomyces sp. T32_za158]
MPHSNLPMLPLTKLPGKFPKFSQITNIFLKDKNQRLKKKGWEILPDESSQHLARPKPRSDENYNDLSLQRDITSRLSDVPDNTRIAGTITGSTDSLTILLDPSLCLDLDPSAHKLLAESPCSRRKDDTCSDKMADINSSLIVPHQMRVPSDGALSAAHPSPTSLISDVATLINPSDTPFDRTSRPEIQDIKLCSSETPQGSDDAIISAELLKISFNSSSLSFITCGFADSEKVLHSVQSRLAFPSSVRDLGTWTEEVLTEYKVNPDHATSFRQFVHRQRIVEWRRYRVRHTFVAAEYRGEYLVVKVQDATSSETRFLYLDRLIQPKDAHFWKRHYNMEKWLDCVETEGCFDLEIDPRVTVTRKGLRESRDLRLIFGLWIPCDRIIEIEDWPHNDVKREGHVFEPNDQPDLLDLFIAARAVHLDANFSMFRRQDHWFTKMLSRVLNQKWDKSDVLSVTDKEKFDRRYRLQTDKWDRMPVSDLRHKEVLKLRDHCDGKRRLIFVVSSLRSIAKSYYLTWFVLGMQTPKLEDEKALDGHNMPLARPIEKVNNKGLEMQSNSVQNVTDETKRRRPRKLRKSRITLAKRFEKGEVPRIAILVKSTLHQT